MTEHYRYRQQGKFLLSLDQSLLSAIRFVALGYRRNRLAAIGIPRRLRLACTRAIIKDRLRLGDAGNVVELPAFGHIAMAVHRGYKVFDFKRASVTKVFAPGTDSEDAKLEIDANRHSSEIKAAPRFIEEDPGHAWYREEYICGEHATDPAQRSGKDVREYYPAVADCLLDLVGSRPPKLVDTLAHIELHADTSFRSRWLAAGQDERQLDEIVRYIEEIAGWLRKHAKPDQIQLVPSHGDFSLVNTIVTDSGLRFIDWEGLAYGGLYNDLVHFLFVERYYGRIGERFTDEMADFVSRYSEAAANRYPELRSSVDLDFAFARRLYYLERISLLLRRSISSNLCNVIIKSIATFRAYDLDAGDIAA